MNDTRRVRVFLGEGDRRHGRLLAAEILERCRTEGLAGATVFRGSEGYGVHRTIHTTAILDSAVELPLVVEIVDTAERIEGILPALLAMVPEGLIAVEEVALYRSGARRAG